MEEPKKKDALSEAKRIEKQRGIGEPSQVQSVDRIASSCYRLARAINQCSTASRLVSSLALMP